MVKEYFEKVATFGVIGESFLGKIIASVLAVPAVMFLNFTSERTPTLFLALAFSILLICFFSVLFSFKEREDQVVIHSFVGAMIAFYGISLTFKQAVIGLVLFHVFCFAFPFLVFPNAQISTERGLVDFVKIILVTFFAGIAVNIFLRLILWIVK